MLLDSDRGALTLVPEPDDPVLDLRDLPGVREGPELRAAAIHHRRIVAALRALGVPLRGPAAAHPGPVPGRWRDEVSLELRGYQREAIAAWTARGSWGVVLLPTGSGKTRTACAAMAAAGSPTLVLVPTRALLRQWLTEIHRWYSDKVGCFGDGDKRLAPITVATYASMRRAMPEVGHRFGMLVADEAHHFGPGTTGSMLDHCAAGLRLGLTATLPERREVRASIASRLGPVVYRQSVARLAGSALAPFDRRVLTCELEPSEALAHTRDRRRFLEALAEMRRSSPEHTWAEFVRECRPSSAGREALAASHRENALPARWRSGWPASCFRDGTRGQRGRSSGRRCALAGRTAASKAGAPGPEPSCRCSPPAPAGCSPSRAGRPPPRSRRGLVVPVETFHDARVGALGALPARSHSPLASPRSCPGQALSRAALPARLPVKDVVDGPVVKLGTERKLLTNLIKMVAYQAESDLVRLVAPHYRRTDADGRTLIQTALAARASIGVTDGELRVHLAPLSTPNWNVAIAAICSDLNETRTIFPGSNLRLRYGVQGYDRTA